MGGMVGGPGTGVALGAGPWKSNETPCGMLARRTMLAGLAGTWLAGTLMNSPGSMWRAWPAVENGGGSASLTCCR